MKSFRGNKHIWPGYVPPNKNELLSSWIFRNSREHKIKPHSFTKYYLDTSSFWTRDVDKFINNKILHLIYNQTPLSFNQIKNMQLTSYQDIIFNGELLTSYSQGISNLGIYHRKRKQNGLLICPTCLGRDKYYKKNWRLLTSIGCLVCNSYYIDCCPKCLSPIIFQRLAIGEKAIYNEYPMYLCWKCLYDYRKIRQTKLPQIVWDYQNYIDKTIFDGYNTHIKYSFLYFQVIFLILRRVQSSSILWTRIRDAFIKEFDISELELFQRSQFPSFKLRSKILPLIFVILEGWPDNFVTFCKKYNLRYSDFTRGEQELPYWFYKVFRDFF
ncbi:TniQ family protein [Marinifilum caeruleilacunae]|uniref:TniQ domain-containing protein n=1 Tax=Marinifilum caeruleilacunae TaxID=2499076 RepID=A0ABX1WSH7_9BACT|nr:hypothetical protein [Marinifilum caeruleilacunae]